MWLLITIFLALGLRVFWISDMEFKGDESRYVGLISKLGEVPYSPLTPVISEHSGFAHPSGFLYFTHWISLGTSDPVWMATSIAIANGLAIALAAWLNRNSEKAARTFLMCATSFTMVIASRKIWTPDLLCVWVCLFMGLFLYSQQSSPLSLMRAKSIKKTKLRKNPPRRKLPTSQELSLTLSAIAIALTGHMYLPGFCFGAITTTTLLIWFAAQRRWLQFFYWMLGAGLGWLTWVPYLYLIFVHAPGTTYDHYGVAQAVGASFRLQDFLESLGFLLTLPSPFASAKLYLYNYLNYLWPTAPALLLNLLLVSVLTMGILWTGLFLYSFFRLKNHAKKAIQDPLLVVSITVILGTFSALQVIQFGNYLHYWLGAIPFAYYLIAWTSTVGTQLNAGLKRSTPLFMMNRLVYTGIAGSILTVLLFFTLVHTQGGLPGEYWKSYRAQVLEMNPRAH
jgi:hypothetical protein